MFTQKGAEVMNTENGSLFSGRVSTGKVTYFVDVRQAVNERFYISITESRRISDTGFDQSRIFLFEEYLDEIHALISNAAEELRQAAETRGELAQEGSSGRYERSGKPWTDEEEEILRGEFEKGSAYDKIALKLKRSSYAITLRLEKLGLQEAYKQTEQVTSDAG